MATKEKRSTETTRPQLARFFLIEITGNSKLAESGGSGRIHLDRSNDIEIETLEPSDGSKSCRAVVRLNIRIEGTKDNESSPIVNISGKYEGRFLFPVGLSIKRLNTMCSKDSYKEGLVAQVFPLAMAHIKDELEKMGLSVHRLPFGI